MIIGIGMDIVEVERVLRACGNVRFLEKYYTEEERKLIQNKRTSAATNFAAKEAVSKVFGTGFRGFTAQEIEVLRDELGRPYVCLHGNAEKMAASLGIVRMHISLSDTDTHAAAYAIGEGEG